MIIIGQSKFPEGNALVTDLPSKITIGDYTTHLIDEVVNGCDRLKSEVLTGNDKWTEFAKEYREKVLPENANVRLIAVGFGNFAPQVFEYAREKNVDIYDFKRIKELYIRNTSPEGVFDTPPSLDLHCKKGYTRFDGNDFSTFSYFVDIKDIGCAVEKYQDGLFIDNLRYKLDSSAQTKIASDIENTVRKHPEKLTILNNGLTIVCEKVDADKEPIKLIKPRIVNGCQTSWAIYNEYMRAKRANKLSDLNGYVFARVIQTINQAHVKEVTSATNNQNPITPRDKHSDDPEQRDIANAFNKFGHKPILYDYRAGMIEALKRSRSNIIEHYYISTTGKGRTKLRKIENVLAGQLYLSLLGLPIFAKTDKKQIFEEQDVYKTLFYYTLPAEQRFDNETLYIRPNDVKLRTGKIEYFIEDIFFAFAVYKLADAFSGLYDKKVSLYEDPEKTKTAYAELVDKFSFIKRWNFIVVGAVNYIVNSLAKNEDEVKKLRESLIKRELDTDMFWRSTSKIEDQFNFERDLNIISIVNEDAPSGNYVIFGKWIRSISLLLYELVRKAKDTEGEKFNMRKFIELTPTTYTNLIGEISRILALGKSERENKFPLQ